mgnify:CR=1 FL=1
MHKYDDTRKTIQSNNKKVDDVVQEVNNEDAKVQEEVQVVKQLGMQLCNYLLTELTILKTYYNRLLDMEEKIMMCVWTSRYFY